MRNLILHPDPILSKKSTPYTLKKFVEPEFVTEMFNTMIQYNGLGLAAPQLGVSKRVIVLINPLEEKGVCIVNPEFEPVGEGKEFFDEGCLSFPKVFAPIQRYLKIHVKGLRTDKEPIEFEAEGLLAKTIQHEIDHLDGITIMDRMTVISREAAFACFGKEDRAEL